MFQIDTNSSAYPAYIFQCLGQVHVGFVLTYIIISLCVLLGVPGHVWFLWLTFQAGWKIKPTQVLPLNLTLLELVFCIFLIFDILNTFIFQIPTVTSVKYFVFGTSWICRPMIQTCICIEQYLAVLHPVMLLRYSSIHYRVVSVAVAWLMAVGYGLCLGLSIITFPDFVSISVFFTAVAVISFCCVSVLCALKHTQPGDTLITMDRRRAGGSQQKTKAFKNIFVVLLSVVVSYFPQVLFVILTRVQINTLTLKCDIVPLISSLNICHTMIIALLKFCRKIHLKGK